jgi:Mlc titration factor MtfA (ptsG expression regulator)
MGFANTSYRPLIWLLMSGALVWALIALWAMARERPPASKGDALGKLWESLRDGAQRSGLTIAPHEPPRAIAQRIAMAWPMLAEPVAGFTDQYLRLRYEPQSTPASAQMAAMTRALRRLRRGMKQKPMLDDYQDLAGRVPIHDRLPPNLRPRVAQLAAKLEKRVHFTGCGGLTITPFMRRAIAFTAAVPIVNRGAGLYADLRAVLLYPDEFVVTQDIEDENGVVTRATDTLSGQTEDTSRVLLSWSDIELGHARNDGYDVVLHEFAHVIDHHLDGRLSRRDGSGDAHWHDVMEREYEALCEQVDADVDTLIDPYGAEDQAEFFAVATESFFCRSQLLRERHPSLYDALRRLYRLDPAAWSDEPA